MKMYLCKTERPNFGDELNAWMWPRLIDTAFDNDESQLFLGIGSILYDSFPKSVRKVVFGAGYGGYTSPPRMDETWQVYFVRGKLTAKYLSLDPSLALGDAAILIRSLLGEEPRKTHKVSFMPHWESTLLGDWPRVCQQAGIHYLDPCAEVTEVLREIRESELVLTEAMHGAIVSDAVRVPWIPIRPIGPIHRMKWNDWASALGITLQPSILAASSFHEYLSGRVNRKRVTHFLQGSGGRLIGRIAQRHFIDSASSQLLKIASEPPCMSSDAAIRFAHEQMLAKLAEFRRDFPR